MKCNDEIECAESRLLVYSWLGVFSSIGFIVYMIWW